MPRAAPAAALLAAALQPAALLAQIGPPATHRRDASMPYTPPQWADKCLGEYSYCNATGSCTLDSSNAAWCARCGKGQYLCPDATTCAPSADAYRTACPGLAGTHLDETLSEDKRLDYLLAHSNLTDWVPQLSDNAPGKKIAHRPGLPAEQGANDTSAVLMPAGIPHLGIPAYCWLNDDVHGVNGPHATIFPDGCGLGATWDKDLMHAVGRAIGSEARADHNGYVHDGDRGTGGENGVGITMYGPNINLVRDPRCAPPLPLSPRHACCLWLLQALD